MQLSNVQETSSLPRKVYTGIENFRVAAVNPTLKELNDMGIPAVTEPEYLTKITRDFGEGEKEYNAVNIRIYLENEDTTNPIKTQVNYQIIEEYHLSTTNKFKVINKFGNTTWLEDKDIKSGILPSNMQWYVNDGVKKCYRGEDDLISFIKAYRNLPNISLTSSVDDKKKGIAMLEQADLDKMFKGNFTDIQNAIMSVKEDGKVGYLLGVKHLDDKDVQTLYRQSPLKRYVKKTTKHDYLIKDVLSSLDNGAYQDTTFDLNNLNLKEFSSEDKITADSDDELVNSYSGEDDDLPF